MNWLSFCVGILFGFVFLGLTGFLYIRHLIKDFSKHW